MWDLMQGMRKKTVMEERTCREKHATEEHAMFIRSKNLNFLVHRLKELPLSVFHLRKTVVDS